MAECQQTPAVEVTKKSHDDELMIESVLNVNEVMKSKVRVSLIWNIMTTIFKKGEMN